MLVIRLFMFSLASCFSFRRLYLSKDLSISSKLSILLVYCCLWESIDPVSVMSLVTYIFISNFIDMSPLPLFLDKSG